MAIIRLVDNLGRVVLPNELMPKVGLEKGDEVTIEVYDNSFLICQLFKRVEVGRDYKVSVELNMTYKQFCNEWGNEASIYMAV